MPDPSPRASAIRLERWRGDHRSAVRTCCPGASV